MHTRVRIVLWSAVSISESEQFAGLVAVAVVVVMGEGRASVVDGGKYAARSPARSSLSASASGATCVITSARSSLHPRHGYSGTVVDVGGLSWSVVVVVARSRGESAIWVSDGSYFPKDLIAVRWVHFLLGGGCQ